MADMTGLRGLLTTARSMTGPSKKEDINLPDENPKRKKKGLFERFKDSRPDADRAAIENIQKAIRGGQKK